MRNLNTLKLIFTLVIVGSLSMNSIKAQTWTQQTSNTTEDLNSVHFFDANVGGAAGFNGTILTTTNGGTTWTNQTSGVTVNLFDIFFADSQTAYSVGLGGTILKSTNGGTTWVSQTSGTTQLLLDVFFVNPLEGWVVGNSGTILHTINGGTTWTPQSGMNNAFKAVYFISPSEGWAVGYPLILHTTNAGTTWSQQTAPVVHYNDVHFINATEGWVVGENSIGLKTMDGGITWNSSSFSFQTSIIAVHYVSSSVGYINLEASLPSNNTLRKTTDGGVTYQVEPTGVNARTTDSYFINAGLGWVVGYDGVILKYNSGTGIDNINDNSNINIYPNPATNKFEVKGLMFDGAYELRIFDVMGKEVLKTNVIGEKSIIDVTNIKNGIYYVQISNSSSLGKSAGAYQKLVIQH